MKFILIIITACMGLFGTSNKDNTVKQPAPAADEEYFRIWINGKLYTPKPDSKLAKTFNSAQNYVQGRLTDDAGFYLTLKAAAKGKFPFGDVAKQRGMARFVFSTSTEGYATDYVPCSDNKETIYAKGYVVITKQPQKKGDYLEGYITAEPSKVEPLNIYFLSFCKLTEASLKAEFKLRKDY